MLWVLLLMVTGGGGEQPPPLLARPHLGSGQYDRHSRHLLAIPPPRVDYSETARVTLPPMLPLAFPLWALDGRAVRCSRAALPLAFPCGRWMAEPSRLLRVTLAVSLSFLAAPVTTS